MLADNAAGAQLPDTAIAAVNTFLRQNNAQKGNVFARGEYTMETVAAAKHGIGALLGVDPQGIGFGANATTISFNVARVLAPAVASGDTVAVTAADHQSNVAPLMWLQNFGAKTLVVDVDEHGDLDEASFDAVLATKPKIVALPWSSNATGTVYDLNSLARRAKAAGALVVVDGVQAAPHFALQIDTAVDFAFFSAYKVFAPHFGFWYASPEFRERVLRADDEFAPGGPLGWTLETGTQNFEGIAGWNGTLAYLRECGEGDVRRGMEAIERYESRLSAYACEQFAARRERIDLYGRPPDRPRLPVFAFNLRGVDGFAVAELLDDAGIEARIGDYYSPRLMNVLAPEREGIALRLSFAHYNTMQDLDRCFAVLDEIAAHAEARSVTP